MFRNPLLTSCDVLGVERLYPQKSPTDGKYSLYYTHVLSKHEMLGTVDMSVLENRRWIGDDLIDWYLILITATMTEAGYNTLRYVHRLFNRAYVTYSTNKYAHRRFAPIQITNYKDHLKDQLKANMSIKDVLVLSAVNIDNNHWVLVGIDPAEKTVWYTIHTTTI